LRNSPLVEMRSGKLRDARGADGGGFRACFSFVFFFAYF
jgi:hypothetical protein